MAPTRNNKRSIRRLSSPLLPNALLPSISMRQGTTNAKLRAAAEESLAAEEAERLAMNDKVYASLEAALASPNNKAKRNVARWDEEDYQDLYGKFVPEHATPAWLAKKGAAYDALVEHRSSVVHLLHIHHADELRAYFAAEAAFERDFGTPFEVDDGVGPVLLLKHHLLDHHNELMHRAHGDPGEAFEVAGEPFTYSVVNPYRGDDERRVEFDAKLRRMYAFYRVDGATPRHPTLEQRKFVFDLPNTYGELDERRLTYWCHRRIWKDDIDTLMNTAKADAALPKPPPRAHYAVKASEAIVPVLGNAWPPIVAGARAHRLLKCLPLLPSSPFDRKIIKHRLRPSCRSTVAMPAPQVEMACAAQGVCLPGIQVSGFSDGEAVERAWVMQLKMLELFYDAPYRLSL
ncbi:hypothetical protein FB451DRAFT_1194982 [Mycena latifolia]|nr:hypothetical protein FB451DRAFT_1194982 [Mycena latifolia]